MIDTDEQHIYADDIIWALIEDLDLDGIDDPEQIGEFPGGALDAKLPYIGVEVIDGGQDMFASNPVVTIDVFAETRQEAKSLSADISLAILRYPRSVPVGEAIVTIDEATCTSLPVKRPWDDPEIRRQSATYQFTARR